MPERMAKFLQIAPHSLAVVLSWAAAPSDQTRQKQQHTGYEIFADFKAENMQHFWNKRVTDAISEAFFLGWIDKHVLLIQGKESHLEVLREAWMRRSLKPPRGFDIQYLVSEVNPVMDRSWNLMEGKVEWQSPGKLLLCGEH